jgi:soluble lytic murein transglycosylase-like protein
MIIKNRTLFFAGLIVSFSLIFLRLEGDFLKIEDSSYPQNQEKHRKIKKTFVPSNIETFDAIKKHSNNYDVPFKYALGIAYKETRYKGPNHWNYNPRLVSSGGALGAMQIMPSTGKMLWKDREVTEEMLLHDTDFNVETSMKLLSRLYDKYKDWKIVFGCYNTGKPIINSYAEEVYYFNPNKI